MQVAKIKQTMLPDSREGSVRPIIRTFYDHLQVNYINFLEFLVIILDSLLQICWEDRGSYMTNSRIPLMPFKLLYCIFKINCFEVGTGFW